MALNQMSRKFWKKLTSQSTLVSIIEDCHHLKNICRILYNLVDLKSLEPESVNMPEEMKLSLMKVCVYTIRDCGPNIQSCGVLVTCQKFFKNLLPVFCFSANGTLLYTSLKMFTYMGIFLYKTSSRGIPSCNIIGEVL